ncbi:MAG TPA: hypothetical protein VK907_04020, partial [Phnomibacter sp.]|nr:hypothetical protein [Phnomibacter sp.]
LQCTTINCSSMKENTNNHQAHAAQWADDVLNSIDGMQRAPANPFLYTRIMARIREANSPWEKVANWVSRPAFAIAGITVFLAINILVIMQDHKAQPAVAVQKLTIDQMLAAEFSNTQTYSLVEVNEER